MNTDNNNDLRRKVLQKNYLMKDEHGHVIETEKKLYYRVAMFIAAVEAMYGANAEIVRQWAMKFFLLMSQRLFLPCTPVLMNAGRPRPMLSACFVLPVEDSIEDIFGAVTATALVQKAGGGTGFSFGRLRPTGDRVASSGGTTSGPISFMKVFSEATNAIQQGAFRRGANMGILPIDHPDIVRFIHAKDNPEALTNFNLSVAVTDVFMDNLIHEPDAPHIVVNPRDGSQYNIPKSINVQSYTLDDLVPANASNSNCLTVSDIWKTITASAWASGEPGLIFIDTINHDNPTPALGRIEATNPCGEQPLMPYECCTLGSINLSELVKEDGSDLDWDRFAEIITIAVRFLDNTIDANWYPLAIIEQTTKMNRKIGLGIMGFADALIRLGIRYDSPAAQAFANHVSAFLEDNAQKASQYLAKERGCFPNWDKSFWQNMARPVRNATMTTIAPTGTISIAAGCSGGIEPVFAFTVERKALDGKEFTYLHPLLEELGTKQGWLTDDVRTLLVQGTHPRDIGQIPLRLRDTLITAHEVSPECHVCIQAIFQGNIGNAVSKTVNLPACATIEDVDKVFKLAGKVGCKGVTVYRDGCRKGQVLTKVQSKTNLAGTSSAIQLRPRPRTTTGQTTKSRMGCGTLFVSVNRDDHGICEVFGSLGKAGGCPAQSEATCRAVSAALRCGVDPSILIEQLKGIRCLSTVSRRKIDKEIDVLSCPDAIARALEEALGSTPTAPKLGGNKCPECESNLRYESGCNICDNCGYSKCG